MTVDEIIRCPKRITRKKRTALVEEHRHLRADISLDCSPNPFKMTMFLRRLIELPEDFTVGLRMDEPCEPFQYAVVLVRFQGPHGGQSIRRTVEDLHNSTHIHKYSEEDMLCRRKRASFKEPATFTYFDEAIVDFLDYCHISDPYGIFDEERDRSAQLRMPLDEL